MGGSKRGSAGVESLAGEGVGEEEFLARFNTLINAFKYIAQPSQMPNATSECTG